MIPNDFSIEVVAFGERNKVIESCRSCLIKLNSDILDVKMFSDMLMNFLIEVPQTNLDDLIIEIRDLGWKATLKQKDTSTRKDILQGNLSITFASGSGDRKDFIPAVPG